MTRPALPRLTRLARPACLASLRSERRRIEAGAGRKWEGAAYAAKHGVV